MYLYNLSNSPVLISEGPPSIYLDYPCPSAASFLPLLLLLGCVCVRAVLHLLPPGVVCALPGRSLQGVLYGNDTTLLWERRAFLRALWPGAYIPVVGGVPDCSPLPSARPCWKKRRPPTPFQDQLQQTPNSLFNPLHVEPEAEASVRGERRPSGQGDHSSAPLRHLQPPPSVRGRGLGRISAMTPSAFLDK